MAPASDSIRDCAPIATASECQDAVLRRVLALWLETKADDQLPGTGFADPFVLRFALGSIVIYDVLREPLRFRYRLVGTEIISRAGFDLTGRMQLDHPDPAFALVAQAGLERCVEIRAPMILRGTRVIHGVKGDYEAVALPLVDGIGRVARILAVQRFAPGTPRME